MDTMLLRIFQRQVRFQCQAILVGTHDFNRAATTDDMIAMWIAVQNILGAAANASKALWGQGGRLAQQRKQLRESLQVDETSPLRDVVMRNHFDHYDQRLDQWWKTSAAHNHLDMSIMTSGTIEGIDDGDMFRVFDPTSHEIIFWGQRFDINALAREAGRLLPLVTRESQKPRWDPPSMPGGGGQ